MGTTVSVARKDNTVKTKNGRKLTSFDLTTCTSIQNGFSPPSSGNCIRQRYDPQGNIIGGPVKLSSGQAAINYKNALKNQGKSYDINASGPGKGKSENFSVDDGNVCFSGRDFVILAILLAVIYYLYKRE